MSDSREHMLNLIHNAVRMGAAAQPPYDASAAPGSVNGTGPQQAPAAADAPPVSRAELVDLFIERLRDYGASVTRCERSGACEALRAACERHTALRVVIAPGIPDTWRPGGIELIVDQGLDPQALDAVDGVITGSAVAIALSGTIALDAAPDQGRRALSLIPDLHLCVVDAENVVAALPEALELLSPSIREGRPITFISGPSATSDIELRRVQGVHGPRRLEVIVTEP